MPKEKEPQINHASVLREELRNTFFGVRGKAEKIDTSGELSRQRVEEDPFEQFYSSQNLLLPPYDFDNLYSIYEENDVLQSCVDAMQNNVDGFGYDLHFIGDDFKDKEKEEAKAEHLRLKNFFDHANETESWTTIRKKAREDLEVLGNAAFEVVRNLKGEIVLVYYLPFKRMRIAALKAGQEDGIKTKVVLFRDGKPVTLTVRKTFRRFVQLSPSGKKLRWFKSFGDPRTIDATDGSVKATGKVKKLATEIIHLKLNFGGNVYGFPRWIGAVLEAMGRRSAQFVNYDLFDSQGIPPMAVLVSNGVLTDDSVAEIKAMIQSLRGVTKWNRVMLLESHVESSGLEDKGQAKIELKNLSEYRKEDQMFDKYMQSTKHNIRHTFRLPPLYTGATETYCYSADTETLTENGWKFYWEVEDGEKIATLNSETDKLEFHVPDGLYTFDVNEELVHFKNQCIDTLVTKKHDIWCAPYNDQTDWKKEKAVDVLEGVRHRSVFQSSIDFVDGEYPILPGFLGAIDKELFLTWVGYVAADAHIAKQNKGHAIVFSVKKERKKVAYDNIQWKIAQEIPACSFNRIHGKNSHTGYLSSIVCNETLHSWARDNMLTVAEEKKLPDWALSLPPEEAEILLEALLFGDGTICGPNSMVYYSTSKKLADQVQILAFKLGYRTKIKKYLDTRPNRKDVYHVALTPIKTCCIERKQIELVPYSGKVFCFEVPNHLFVTRRNGKIGIHGNTLATSKASKTVAEEQVFVPEREGFDEAVNRLIVFREFQAKYWRYRTKGPRIVGAEEISKGVETFSKAGAFSVNHAIEMANEAFGLSMSKYPGKWAEYPISFITKLIESGVTVEGLDELLGGETIPVKGGTTIKQLPFPIPVAKGLPAYVPQKIMDSDLFKPEEKEVYKKLLMIQGALESMAEEGHSHGTEFDSQDSE